MKNIAVFSVLVIMFFPICLFGEEKQSERGYAFSFGTQFGLLYGQAEEYVYPIPGDTKGELLSELLYDMKPVIYYGVQLEFGRINPMSAIGFFALLSFKAGVPGDSGTHENRDWQSIENDALTNFSSHTNETRDFYRLDAIIGASFPVMSYFYIKPFISGSWMYFAFTGRDGYTKYANEIKNGVYGPIEDAPKKNIKGEVIRYQQHWLLAAAGINIGTNILSPLLFDLSFQISPLTYCAAVDNHLMRNPPRTFYDFTSFGLFMEPKGSISLIYKQMVFSLEAAYSYIGRTRGETYYIDEGSKWHFLSQAESGAGLSVLDARFLVKIRFY